MKLKIIIKIKFIKQNYGNKINEYTTLKQKHEIK